MGLIEQLELYCQPIYQVTTLGAAQPCDYEVLLRKKGGRPVARPRFFCRNTETQPRRLRGRVFPELKEERKERECGLFDHGFILKPGCEPVLNRM